MDYGLDRVFIVCVLPVCNYWMFCEDMYITYFIIYKSFCSSVFLVYIYYIVLPHFWYTYIVLTRYWVGLWQELVSEQKKPYHSDQRTSTARTPCPSCGIAHWGECRRVTGACFKCGKTNHQIKDCPELKNEPKKTNARLFSLGGDGAEADPSVITGDVPISGIMTRVLIDFGATHSFASKRFVRRLGQVPD